MQPPPAIIFVNSDIDAINTLTLQRQLYINDTMTDIEFDARVAVDPNYPTNVHLQGLRILVIRQDFHNLTNRTLADVVIFVKQGMATVLQNNFGPPVLSLPILRFNLFDLLRFNGSPFVAILPQNLPPPISCNDCACDSSSTTTFQGIFAIEARDSSGVHCANPDAEFNNPNFINRK